MANEYKIGQILTFTQDTELQKVFGDTEIVKKGSRIIIGADKLAHHLNNGNIQPLQKDDIVSGYDADGIAEYITLILKSRFPIKEMLEDYDMSENDFKNEIISALDEIGLC